MYKYNKVKVIDMSFIIYEYLCVIHYTIWLLSSNCVIRGGVECADVLLYGCISVVILWVRDGIVELNIDTTNILYNARIIKVTLMLNILYNAYIYTTGRTSKARMMGLWYGGYYYTYN